MKDYREKELKCLLILYILLLIIWCTQIFNQTLNIFEGNSGNIFSIIEGLTISGVISLVAFISDSVISSNQKDKLVGLFLIPKPGYTIFTRIKSGRVVDDRFINTDAAQKYSSIIENLPTEKKYRFTYENAQWYKIYTKHQERKSIFQAQKDYLLCRDLFVETLVFICAYFISLIVFREIVYFSWSFIITLTVFAILTNIASHIKMNRFVNSVIAVDISFEIKK